MLAKFGGTARFQVISRLGAGGMGAVYHVYDRERGVRVALKTVGLADGQALLRFKREFRALRDIIHPNLIALDELFEIDGEWFYTMELIDGVELGSYVRNRDSRDTSSALEHGPTDVDEMLFPTWVPPARDAGDVGSGPAGDAQFDEMRLRAALAQLAQGLAALHAANKVHRDMKPSNILVDPTGRVVILDFGLVTDVSAGGVQATDIAPVGTIAYMAPEQASGRPVDARADWYSVGVLLFEAMTGQLPFGGHSLATVARKLTEEAPDPRSIVPDLPADLASLCSALLRMDPAARPSERQIFERLHVQRDASALAHSTQVTVWGRRHFVGRAAELALLDERFGRLERGEGSTLVLGGEVGIGKTLIVRRFVQTITDAHPEALVLTGRCLQRESVPFKALDGVVDALSSHLHRLEVRKVDALLPPGADVLPRAFPVLRRIASFASASRGQVRDPQEQRARVFTAFRELLANVARTRPTIVWIDDLQWLDDDSGALLGELLRPPAAAPVLFIATERTEPSAGVVSSRLRAVVRDGTVGVHVVPRMTEAEATELATRLLEGKALASWAPKIGSESAGHPHFVDELAQYVELVEPEVTAPLRLDDAVSARLVLLDGPSLELLRLVAVGEGPIMRQVVAHASGRAHGDFDRCCSALEALRLLRAAGALATDPVEPFHARIATAALLGVDETERRELHARVARAMEGLPGCDPVDLALHWSAAEEPRRAAEWYVTAATQAAQALAFDRAAEMYRRSLALEPKDGPGLEDRKARLAQALANAGRGLAAGETYLEAAASAPAGVALDLRRRASEQLMLSGHIERGIASFREVLREVGLWYPPSPVSVVLSIAWTRFVLWLRRYEFRPKDDSLVDPHERLRTDVSNSIYLCFIHTDPIRGVYFQGRALMRALRLGEPGRVAMLLATRAAEQVTADARLWKKAGSLLERARFLADRSNLGHARAVCTYGEGMSLYLMGRWIAALERMASAEHTFREECPDTPAELRTLQAVVVQCLWETGQWNELRERLSRSLKESEERGDIFTETTFRAGMVLHVRYLDDDAEAGLEAATATMRSWSGKGFGVQSWNHTVYGATALDYMGRLGEGYDRIDAAGRGARWSLLNRVQLMRAGWVRGRALRAVSAAVARPSERRRLLASAMADARLLEREDSAWAKASAHLVRGCAHGVAGKQDKAVAELSRAISSLDEAQMRGWAAAARWAKGALLGGEEGDRLVAEARAFMEEQHVVRPERVAATMAPVLFALDPSRATQTGAAAPRAARKARSGAPV